jgi:hypothetical protein
MDIDEPHLLEQKKKVPPIASITTYIHSEKKSDIYSGQKKTPEKVI